MRFSFPLCATELVHLTDLLLHGTSPPAHLVNSSRHLLILYNVYSWNTDMAPMTIFLIKHWLAGADNDIAWKTSQTGWNMSIFAIFSLDEEVVYPTKMTISYQLCFSILILNGNIKILLLRRQQCLLSVSNPKAPHSLQGVLPRIHQHQNTNLYHVDGI